jgi:hypothetical protein
MKLKLLVCGIAVLWCTATQAQKAEHLGASGNWEILRTKDPMTDKVRCAAVLRKSTWVDLTHETLAVSYRGRGGVQGYQLRLDDQPATGMRLATELEEQVGAILLPAAKLVKAKRLRISGVTLIQSLISEDIDLTGIDGAYKVLIGPKCR